MLGNRSTSSNQIGMSLIEALVAAGILAFTISIGSYLIVQAHKSSSNLTGASLCKVRSEMLTQTFADTANKTKMSNWVYSNGNTYPSGPQVAHPELGLVVGGTPSNIVTPNSYETGTSLPANGLPVVLPSQTNGWELIDASPNWALYLASRYPTFCDVTSVEVVPTHFGQIVGPGASQIYPATVPSFVPGYGTSTSWGGLAPPQNPPPSSSVLNNEIDSLNIRMVNSNGIYGCPGKVPTGGSTPFPSTLVPSSQASKLTGFSSGADITMEIVGTIQYSNPGDPAGAPTHYCQSSTRIKLDSDNTPAKFINPTSASPALPNSLMPASPYCGPAPNNQMCITNAGGVATPAPSAIPYGPLACDPPTSGPTTGFNIAFQVNEPATVFGCTLSYSPAALPAANPASVPFVYLCGTSTTVAGIPVTMTVTPYGSANPSSYIYGSGEMVNISGGATKMPEGYYRFWVRAFDSAQNVTDQWLDFQISEFNTTTITLNPPSPQIAAFNAFPVATRNHLPVSATYNFSFPGQIFECSDTVFGDNWTVSAVPPSTFAPQAVWSYTPASSGVTTQLSGLACQPSVLTPGALTNGIYTMNASACNACGAPVVGATPVTQQWIVDMTTGPTPVHAPTSAASLPAPGSDFAGPPTWTFLDAKPPPLPYEYSCQQVSPFSLIPIPGPTPPVASCVPTGFPTIVATGALQPCTQQGSFGFCTGAVDGCGNLNADTNTPYEITAAQGQSCCNVPCQAGLICAMDNSINRGTCVLKVSCTQDIPDCSPFGTCYKTQGTCNGAGPGPAPQTCGAIPTPPPLPTPIPTVVVTATPTPTPAPTATPTSCAYTCNTFAQALGYSFGSCVFPCSTTIISTGGTYGNLTPPFGAIGVGCTLQDLCGPGWINPCCGVDPAP
jgi:hypothetical protein